MYIFVLNSDGLPLMPTKRNKMVREVLKNGDAKIVSHSPFTIQFLKPVKNHVQELTFGGGLGYKFLGYSVVGINIEYVGGEFLLRCDISDLIEEKSNYRNLRRQKLRYRKARFNNRKVEEGWIPPSIEHKKESQIKLIKKICSIIPVKNIILEVGNFDIQKINNPDISGVDYQNGDMKGFSNVKEYVRFRDDHECQNPTCKNEDTNKILQVHHIKFRKFGGSDAPSNQITLCSKCHQPKHHEIGGYLHQWMLDKKKPKADKSAAYMNITKNSIMEDVKKIFPDKNVSTTLGYITKYKRSLHNIEKTHHNDAFVIANGSNQKRIEKSTDFTTIRRNNRSLQSFTDAKYIDSRTGEVVKASQLSNGRTKRNKNTNTENERIYRRPILKLDKKTGIMIRDKSTKGGLSIRTERHNFQKGTICIVTQDWENSKISVKKGDVFTSIGTQNKGVYVLFQKDGKNFYIPTKNSKEVYKQKGIVCI